MFEQMKNTIIVSAIGIVITTAVATTGYGALYLADNRYVQQKQWVQESRNAEYRRLQYRINELEWTRDNGSLSAKEDWELKQLKSEQERLK
jgi:hypothetical protein